MKVKTIPSVPSITIAYKNADQNEPFCFGSRRRCMKIRQNDGRIRITQDIHISIVMTFGDAVESGPLLPAMI